MPVLTADRVAAVLRRGGSARLDAGLQARFAAGDAVRARNRHPAGHTRLPRYVRGRRGQIVRDHGTFIFPDANARGVKTPERLYSVRFRAAELWGSDSPAGRAAVYLDLFESYLEQAS